MAVSNASGKLQEYIKKNFPDSKADLFAVFIERCGQLAKQNGYQAMITQHAWMFLSSFETLRAKLQAVDTVNMAHLGARAFEEVGGEVVQTTSFVMRRSHGNDYKGTYCRLIEPTTQQGKEATFLAEENRYVAKQNNFSKIPGSPITYWLSANLIRLYEHSMIGSIFSAKEGVGTRNDNAFLRLHWEVEKSKIGKGKRWILTDKAGGYRKWHLGASYVMDWENDGFRIKNYRNDDGSLRSRPQNTQFLFKPGISWGKVGSGASSFRYREPGYGFNDAAPTLFGSNLLPLLAALNTNTYKLLLEIRGGTINMTCGVIEELPLLGYDTKQLITQTTEIAEKNIRISRDDWDSFETSWDFTRHPLVSLRMAGAFAWGNNPPTSQLSSVYKAWQLICEGRFNQLKANEEELNRIFIDIYCLQDELTPEVEDKDVTVRKADLGRDIRSLLSYAVGCMFGRYSLDVEGLVYAGGAWDASKYSAFLPDADGILPITDEEYLEDDIVSLLCKWLKTVYGEHTLEENLDFIAGALGNRGATSREVIRNYFLKDFFADHCKIYQKRPIYWLFDSGKQNGFKALIYLHRYMPDTIGNVRVDYLHRLQRIYESEIDRMQDMIDHSKSPREAANATKRKEKLQKQLKECRDYDGKIGHLALSRIALDLDDGVKVNYRKVQTASDGKLYEVLADSSNIMGKK